jgi:glyoxylase-like metal-dependent hydrolase (beta-lactamase superfamily II)
MRYSPLFLGIHEVSSTHEGSLLPKHTAAVTLIQTEGKNILVDCGARGTFELITAELAKHKLTPNDIDILILTHFHLDHAFNVALFPNARVIGWMHEWRNTGTLRIAKIQDFEVVKGVKVFPTPGHAEEHLAVEVLLDSGEKLVIAGDAIEEQYVKTKDIHRFAYDKDLYKKSADEIIKRADIIIPGHGEIISVIHQ